MPTTQRLHKSVCVPFNEENYTTLLEDPEAFRGYLNAVYQEHPELFPEGMGDGFYFHDFVTSRKQQLRLRRIQLHNGQVCQIRPSFVMPYMVARTEEKALYLRGARTRREQPHRVSPFEDLNGFHYHDNWLHSFMIAASRAGNPP